MIKLKKKDIELEVEIGEDYLLGLVKKGPEKMKV